MTNSFNPEAWYNQMLAAGQQPVLADYGNGHVDIRISGRDYDDEIDRERWAARSPKHHRRPIEVFLRSRGLWMPGFEGKAQ
jgi:hypothetical protein